jgi:WD40 repeat protein
MISCSLDATVKLWNIRMKENDKVDIEKEPFEELYDSDSPVECVDALNIPGAGIMVAAGASDGSLTVWMYVDGGKSIFVLTLLHSLSKTFVFKHLYDEQKRVSYFERIQEKIVNHVPQ